MPLLIQGTWGVRVNSKQNSGVRQLCRSHIGRAARFFCSALQRVDQCEIQGPESILQNSNVSYSTLCRGFFGVGCRLG